MNKSERKEENTMKQVQTITISVIWKKNRQWGKNPHAIGTVAYEDGTQERLKETCSGCGYDKLSEVVADILNRTPLKAMLKAMLKEGDKDAPYGIKRGYFEGGIGIDCYSDFSEDFSRKGILQYLGYSCRHFPEKDTDFILIERRKCNEN